MEKRVERRRRSPLRRRHLRDLRGECGKYLVIFLLLVFTIGFISGFLVADGSMIIAYNDSFSKYNMEDGNFRTDQEISHDKRRDIEGLGIRLYDNFYVEKNTEEGNVLRVFALRDRVNLLCLMRGDLPRASGEMALDRMYADNNKISVGDRVRLGRQSYTVTGLVAFPDYSALFRDNADAMFDAVKFGVAAVGPWDFDSFPEDQLTYNYSWQYDDPPATREAEKEAADRLMEEVGDEVYLEDFLPRYLNQAITFTGEDLGSDRAMMLMLLYIVIVIMAFVFAVTINDTIAREAAVIGTLRASGFTRMELVRHYMAMPLLITLAAALAGNILGYTWLKEVCAGMYYGSYSLPAYVTVWNGEAFVLTTAVPLLIMVATTFLTLWWRLSLPPLQFLRRELRKRARSRALRLPPGIPFPARFRLRVFFQNMGNYAILLAGILFANILLLFGMALPAVLDRYQASMRDNMLCAYQYFLRIPAYKTDKDYDIEKILTSTFLRWSAMSANPDAEPFSSYSLQIPEGEALRVENITVYGIQKNSRYVRIGQEAGGEAAAASGQAAEGPAFGKGRGNHAAGPAASLQADGESEGALDGMGSSGPAHAGLRRGQVWASSALADKLRLDVGDTIRLKEPYEDKYYEFRLDGIYDYRGGLCLFMRREDLCEAFGIFDDYLSGYFSDSQITDIPSDMVATLVDYDALIKISRQLDVSMGGMMSLVDGFAVGLFLILIYLLSKIIIEKNAQPISMAKILGYTDREIAGLYIATTSIVTLAMLAATIPLADAIMHTIFQYYLAARMTGWITYDIPATIFYKMFLIGAAAYFAVAILELRKIRAIPMADALKDVV